jgi:hypothetical protein
MERRAGWRPGAGGPVGGGRRAVRGDFLFDAAWCSFWAPFLHGIARHHCYEVHIGFTHLGWNVWTRNQAALAATARRLAEVLERGPLPLPGG